jgi:hypothetical protein
MTLNYIKEDLSRLNYETFVDVISSKISNKEFDQKFGCSTMPSFEDCKNSSLEAKLQHYYNSNLRINLKTSTCKNCLKRDLKFWLAYIWNYALFVFGKKP